MLTVAVGDVHGCLDQLKALDKVVSDTLQEPWRYVFLGDYVDRGPDPEGVIDWVRERVNSPVEQNVALLGNHDSNNYEDCRIAQGMMLFGGISEERALWLQTLPLYYHDGERMFVHAGINRDSPWDQQRRHDLLWIREQFLQDERQVGPYVVHGHTPMNGPEFRVNRCNLDTACVFGNYLCAGVFRPGLPSPFLFLNHHGGRIVIEERK